MNFPNNLRYTKEHEWASIKGDVVTVGITEYAQESLGEVVFVELPAENSQISNSEVLGSVESVKAVSDLFSPVGGTVIEINDSLGDSPELVNEDPYGDAWMVRLQVKDTKEFESLMDASAYQEFVKSLAD